jgi:hypothetical protein
MTTTNPPANSRVTREARLRWVPIPQMQYAHGVSQREKINQARVDHIASELDLEQIGNPAVSDRGDYFIVLDGMHRIEALKQHGYGDQQIQCWTYTNLSEEEEAEIFLKLNDTLRVSAFDKFQASVRAGRPTESDVERIVRRAGLTVARTKDDGAVGCVGTLIKVYKRSGSENLARTLHIVRDAYGTAGMDQHVSDGLGLLCQRFNGQLDPAIAIGRLSSVHGGVDGLLGRARAAHKQRLGSLPHCVAASAVEIINAGKGGKKLPVWWK